MPRCLAAAVPEGGGLFEAGPLQARCGRGSPSPSPLQPDRESGGSRTGLLGCQRGSASRSSTWDGGREERRWCGAGTGLSSEPGGWPVPEVGSGPKWPATPALVPYRSPPACRGIPQLPRTLLPSPSPSPAQRQRLLPSATTFYVKEAEGRPWVNSLGGGF